MEVLSSNAPELYEQQVGLSFLSFPFENLGITCLYGQKPDESEQPQMFYIFEKQEQTSPYLSIVQLSELSCEKALAEVKSKRSCGIFCKATLFAET